MKNVILLGSAGILFLVGCSGNSRKTASSTSAPVLSPATANATPAPAPAPQGVPLPVPSVASSNSQIWHLEKVKDRFSEGVELKTTSLDGKYDLVILQEGRQAFLSFARHGHWESAHNRPGKGKLMFLRARFEDGEEKHIEWDELGFGTENLFAMLWSYPAPQDAFGPAVPGSKDDSFGGDRLLIQELLKHKTVLLEVAPVVTAQFDLTGLVREMEKARSPKTEPILEARGE